MTEGTRALFLQKLLGGCSGGDGGDDSDPVTEAEYGLTGCWKVTEAPRTCIAEPE